jgi:Protein of unknown function (DUF3768)
MWTEQEMKDMSADTAEQIRTLNDQFRKAWCVQEDGTFGVIYTPGVVALDENAKPETLARVVAFTEFNEDNDPHGEHDFGSFTYRGETLFWKIDTYDSEMKYGSSDPADANVTTRVLTIMLASEY